mgnify:CR=1 FL=1
MRPLDGIRIIDLTHALAGPFCTYQLAMLGAEIIKIENPGTGDDFRGLSKVTFDAVNSGKRSVSLNLKHPEALGVLERLSRDADVIVDNFKPGTAAKFGITWELVQQWSPRLIWCSISGFGLEGPWRDKPAVEWSVQAASGLSDSYLGEEQDPRDLGLGVLDLSTGATACSAIMAALLQRSKTGAGMRVDVGMLDVALNLMAPRIPVPGPSRLSKRPAVGRFMAKDRPVFLMGAHQRWFEGISAVLGEPELVKDERFATPQARQENMEPLRAALEAKLSTRTADEWEAELTKAGVPASTVRELAEVQVCEHVRQRGSIREVRVSQTDEKLPVSGLPFRLAGLDDLEDAVVPALGEHTEDELAKAGYDTVEIENLKAAGVI